MFEKNKWERGRKGWRGRACQNPHNAECPLGWVPIQLSGREASWSANLEGRDEEGRTGRIKIAGEERNLTDKSVGEKYKGQRVNGTKEMADLGERYNDVFLM